MRKGSRRYAILEASEKLDEELDKARIAIANEFLPEKELEEIEVDDLGGGLNEAAPPNEIPFRECLICENTRVAEDGRTKEKRPGITKLDSIYNFASKKIFGAFGIEESDEVKVAAFLEDDIQLKSGNEWTSIFSPTKKIEKPISVVQDKGLVLVAGYEKIITIKDEEANYSGIEAPLSAPTVETGAAGADKKTTEYAQANQDHCGELGQAAGQTLLAQSFKVDIDSELTKVVLKLRKIGSPTGNLWIEIHESKSGTSASKNTSATIVGQATDNLDVSTVGASFVKTTNTSIAFVSSTKKITDSNNGLAGFLTGDRIEVTGSVSNDGIYTVATGGVAGEIVVSEDLVDEAAGDSITIETVYVLTFSGTKPDLDDNKTYYLVVYRDFAVSDTNFLLVGFDNSSPDYEDGKYWQIDGSLDWGGYSSINLVFEVFGIPTVYERVLQFGPVETGTHIYLRQADHRYLLAQSFKLPGFDADVSSIKLALKKQFYQADNIWVEVHSSQVGTSETKGASTNIVGEASDDVSTDDVPEDYTWIEFTFSGTKPSLSADTTYYIVLYCDYEVGKPYGYISWTLHDKYEDGAHFNIVEAMTWTEASGDNSFDIIARKKTEVKVAEYELSNHDDIKELRQTSAATLLAQEFLVYEDNDVTKVKLYLSKVGSLTGKYVWAEIHGAQGGTSETKDLSDDIVGEASDSVDADTLSAFPTHGWVTFTFSGVKPDIKADKVYYLVIYGDFTVSSTNYVRVGMDKIDPTYTVGKRWDIDSNLDWTPNLNIDIVFELWTLISDVLGTYSYVITYLRWGNFPCESNPSPPSEEITITSGNQAELSNIPVSPEPEVTHKNIWRNKEGEEERYWVDRIENSVTEYEDSLPDSGLGDEVSYESYPPPVGDSIEIWDDSLWVCGVEGYPESLFRSRQGYLEQFKSTANSIFPLREDEASPVLRAKEFNNYLYPFKKTSIWVISRSGIELVVDKMVYGKGTCAGQSVAECGDKKLRFLSNYYEIEEFDGFKLTTMELPNKVKKVLKTINKTHAHKSVGRNHEEENEYRLAIPTGSSMVPNKVIIFNYKDKNFFVDTYHQKICSISVVAIEKGQRAMLYGTEEGELYKVDPDSTTDDGQLISMRFRTGWIGSKKWIKLRQVWIDFILPEDKILVFKVYSNFRDAPELDINLEGSTPTGPDPELRNVIHQRVGVSAKGSFFSFEFINTEDVGDLLQIIKFWLCLKTEPGKRTISAE